MTHNYAFLKILGFRAIRVFFLKNQSVLKPQDKDVVPPIVPKRIYDAINGIGHVLLLSVVCLLLLLVN